ncbi:dolichyl-phosphate-mannose-protein mannosyltransferase [Actinomyces sp. oral taxon 448 str. F0400]|nr:dolichyl-phosphate-mannose-protein mannosyltransferase [Actinomyces sp. oral taxon 448 str. F0400]
MHRSSVSPATGSVLGIPGIGRTVSPWWPTTAQWKSWAARMRRPRPRDSPLV